MNNPSASAERLADDEEGATAVEFALVAPVALALMFGILQLGWALHCAASARYALERAMRAVTLNPAMTQDQLATAVREDLKTIANPNEVTVTLRRETVAGASSAIGTATWTSTIGVPNLYTYPISYTATIVAPTT
ncbi:MAG: pilus assembly protein [Alphaproteobacteria bacterium]|nr:pilus assembly protein [Alphaproteobacteria bacterium]